MKGIKFKRTTAESKTQHVGKKLNSEEKELKKKAKKAAKDNEMLAINDEQNKDGENQVANKKQGSFFTFLAKGIVNILNIKKSLGMKISAIFIVSLVVCVAIVGFSSYTLSKNTLENNIVGASEETIKQVSRNMNTTLSNFEDLTFQIMFDEKVTTNVGVYIGAENMLDQIGANRILIDLLSTYIFSNTQLKNIAIIPATADMEPIVSGTVTVNMANRLSTKEYQDKEWFKSVVEQKGRVAWISPQEEGIIEGGLKDTVALARIVTNTDKGKEYVLVMEFNVQDIFGAVNDVAIIDNSYLEIIDTSNMYIKPFDIETVGLDANFDLINNINDPLQGSFHADHKLTNEKHIIVYSQIAKNESWYLVGALPLSEIDGEIKPIFNFTSIMILLATGLAIIIGIVMLRMVSRPLTQISTVMTKGAKGDLTVRAPIMNRSDEIGVLAQTFDDMMIQIEGLARQTTNSAKHVLSTASELTQASQKTATAGKEISIATDEIAAGASSLAVEAEKGSDLTQSINNQMLQVNQSREQMNISASQVDEASEQGLNYMNGLIEHTGKTEQMVSEMVSKVNALSDSTKSIVKILDVLNNITKQTNILSLNATIEAARAGQAGKGFMVVADEIRQLAEQSRQSIDVVGQITETISKEIVETASVLKQAQPIFQEQIVSVKEANQIFISVRTQMDLLKGNIDEVSQAFDHLNDSQETLSQSMNNVSAVAQQSSATSEEVASLSSEQLVISEQLVNLSSQLESVSENLKTQLSKFKINM